ncbi:MAG: pyridoxamine 5'-phosphate oxidase family protein [Promethearchaeota archaeon]
MILECQINGHICILPNYIARFLLKASSMYVGTIDLNGKPRIQPVLFVNEFGKCSLAFLINKQSKIAMNLQKNPNITLTTDSTHPTDSLQNKGIMIEAISQQFNSENIVRECFDNLQKKYNSDVITKILGIDIILKYIKITAVPIKIVYWKGPFFKKFTCDQRRKQKLLKKKENSEI